MFETATKEDLVTVWVEMGEIVDPGLSEGGHLKMSWRSIVIDLMPTPGVAQPVAVEEEKGLSNVSLISTEDETYEEKEDTSRCDKR
ncbi:hypothetical protein TNCV_105611 [Trichonephila clavipes]|nr:hypothetical protein TNCV_105611 [Trichonephila clavipes]